jgi:outer membrane protein assembly factor BamD (BamD/ComL family)
MIVFIGLTFASCTGNENSDDETGITEVDKDKFLINLALLETKLDSDMPKKVDLQKAVTAFQDFASYFPTDDLAPEYLLKASDIAYSLNQSEKSVTIMTQIINEYPEYHNMESVYYNRASHVDTELKDTVLAKKYYLEVIERYPNSKSAQDAQTRIDQHFMSIEELVEMWTSNPIEQEAQ